MNKANKVTYKNYVRRIDCVKEITIRFIVKLYYIFKIKKKLTFYVYKVNIKHIISPLGWTLKLLGPTIE